MKWTLLLTALFDRLLAPAVDRNPVNRSQQVDAYRGIPQLDHRAGFLEVTGLQSEAAETELTQRLENALDVFNTRAEPDIEVARVPRLTVNRQRVPANDQVLNRV